MKNVYYFFACLVLVLAFGLSGKTPPSNDVPMALPSPCAHYHTNYFYGIGANGNPIIIGTNVLYITNCPSTNTAQVGNSSSMVVSFTSPPHLLNAIPTNSGAVFIDIVGNWIQSTTNLNGNYWTNHFFQPAIGKFCQVTFPNTNKSIPCKFFRVMPATYQLFTNP